MERFWGLRLIVQGCAFRSSEMAIGNSASTRTRTAPEALCPVPAAGEKWRRFLEAVSRVDCRQIKEQLKADPGLVVLSDLSGQTSLFHAAKSGSVQAVELLVSYGSDVHHKDKAGHNALVAAARAGHSDVAEALIACGCSVISQGYDGSTALHQAARGGHGDMA
eukprot:scaffold115799_cov48-Prasinocladus_malaysianus.AAC.1